MFNKIPNQWQWLYWNDITEVVQSKPILFLKLILQNTKALQLFTINIYQKLFTEEIKNAEQQGLGRWDLESYNKGCSAQRLEVRGELVIKIRECIC